MDKRTLYKVDSQDSLRFWSVWTEGNEVVQEYGVVGGKPIQNRKECEAKNVGKKNERTPEEQAESEAQSKIDKKLDKAYFETKEEAENSRILLPMKAKTFDDHKDKIDWSGDVFAQKKLDGMRCLAHINGNDINLVSRQGKEIENMEHIKKGLSPLLQEFDDFVFDGELYAHGKTFQENMKLIKKYRPGQTEQVNLHAYDCFVDSPYRERWQKINNSINEHDNITVVDYKAVEDEDSLSEAHAEFLKQSYEGTMVRHGTRGYKENKRDKQLLKYKDFKDIACPITDVVASDARPEQGVIVCEKDGDEFKANLKFPHERREEVLRNKDEYIGETAEIRYFEETDDGLPRFPVCVGFRLDK